MRYSKGWFSRKAGRSDSVRGARGDEFFHCDVCGGQVREGRAACPHCGASEADGWGPETSGEGSDEGWDSDDSFDYDDWLEEDLGIKRESPSGSVDARTVRRVARQWIVWLLVAAFALSLLWPVIF